MPRIRLHSLLFLLAAAAAAAAGGRPDHCDIGSLPDPLTLRPDQLTILISGFSELRIPLLSTLALSYSLHPSVAAVLVLWSNPSTPPSSLSPLLNLTGSAPITLLRLPSPSLNARFLPQPLISTRAVAVCDDDVEIDAASLSFAFSVWRSTDGLSPTGFFARSHAFDLASRSWIYTVHPDRYSIVLTKFLILKTEHLFKYSCDERFSEARSLVDRERNCEDILMNFVAAMEGNAGPTLVEGRRVRDYGDPRNSGSNGTEGEGRMGIGRVGLSARGDHRKKRGWCIREFHRMIGVMPLRYSFGKVVAGVGEQGLCDKGGKLVFCDKEDVWLGSIVT